MNLRIVSIDFDKLDPEVRKLPLLPEKEAAAWLGAQPSVQNAILTFCSQKGLIGLIIRDGKRHFDGTPGETKQVDRGGRQQKVSDGEIMATFPARKDDPDFFKARDVHVILAGKLCLRTIKRRLNALHVNDELTCDNCSPPGYRR